MYKIFLNAKAQRELKNLTPSVVHAIETAIFEKLKVDPFSLFLNVKRLQVPLYGYRLRVGDYRVLFDIEGDSILIYSIKHRKDAYR